METCWFAPYLPDLNWRHPDVVAAGTADLVWWMSRFDLDGLRIDAVPMMPRAASRRMIDAVRAMQYRSGADLYVVGEVFTGPGDGGRSEIRAYLGDTLDGLEGAFDFPLMWAARDAVAHDAAGGFAMLEHELAAGAQAWSGSGATIAHMIGNHDTTRFLSEAAGDAGGDPWSAPPPQPTSDEPYRRQLVALALMLTVPGVPVLYYGDELGLAGASDPDSRRVLPDVLGGALPPAQQSLLDAVAAIGRARRCSPALRGTRTSIVADADHDVALHQSPAHDAAVVVLSRDKSAATVDAPGIPAGTYRDVLSAATITSDGTHAVFTAQPLAAAIYLPEGSACLP
jgi:glycosidase